jgi:hypothetical protein
VIGDLFKNLADRSFSLAGNRSLLYSPVTDGAIAADAIASTVANECDRFRTLEDHLLEICIIRSVPDQTVDALRRSLAQLAEAGILVRKSDLLPRAGAASREAPRIGMLGIATRDRVPVLARALRSYATSIREYGRDTEIVVLDDSTRASTRAEVRSTAEAVSREFAAPVWYAGEKERRRFAQSLARRAGVPQKIADYALLNPYGCPTTPGAARNGLLLHGAGGLMLLTDDDILCTAGVPPETHRQMRLTSKAEPTEYWFYPDSHSAQSAVRFTREDVFGLHERLLARPVRELIDEHGGLDAVDLDGIDARFARRLARGAPRVRVTLDGLVGDCAVASPWHYYYLGGASHNRLVASEDGYRSAFHGRQVVRTVTRTTISSNGFCTGWRLGLDHHDLLPPFPPVGRMEDFVFGYTLRACFRDGVSAILPWLALHAPPEGRESTREGAQQAFASFEAGDMMIALINRFQELYGDRDGDAESLRRLGAMLSGLGSAPEREFEELVRVERAKLLGTRLRYANRCLYTRAGEPPYWVEDIRGCAAALEAVLCSGPEFSAADLEDGSESGVARLQRVIADFGELLEVWPEIVSAARELRQAGDGLARPVRSSGAHPGAST